MKSVKMQPRVVMSEPLSPAPLAGKFEDISFGRFVNNVGDRASNFHELTHAEKSKQLKWVAEYFQKFSSHHENEFLANWQSFEKEMNRLISNVQREQVLDSSDLLILLNRIQKAAKCTFQNILHSAIPITLKAIIQNNEIKVLVSKEQIEKSKSKIFSTSLSAPFKEATTSEIVLGGITTKINFDILIKFIMGERDITQYLDITNIAELMEVACMHGFKSLVNQVKEYLISTITELFLSNQIDSANEIYNNVVLPLKELHSEKDDQFSHVFTNLERGYQAASKLRQEWLTDTKKEINSKVTCRQVITLLNALYDEGQDNPSLHDRCLKFMKSRMPHLDKTMSPSVIRDALANLQLFQTYRGPIDLHTAIFFGKCAKQLAESLLPEKELEFEWNTADRTALFLTGYLERNEDQKIDDLLNQLTLLIDNDVFNWFKVLSCRGDYTGISDEQNFLANIDRILYQLQNANCKNMPWCLKIQNTADKEVDLKEFERLAQKIQKLKNNYPNLAKIEISVFDSHGSRVIS